jgi:hypothetical protein
MDSGERYQPIAGKGILNSSFAEFWQRHGEKHGLQL